MNVKKSHIAIILTLAILTVLGFGYWMHGQEADRRRDIEDDLLAVLRLKLGDIEQWRAERLGDVTTLAENPFIVEMVDTLLQDTRAADRERMIKYLDSVRTHYHYHDVILLNADGQVLLSAINHEEALTAGERESLAQAIANREPVFSDVIAGAHDSGTPEICVAAGVYPHGDKQSAPIAAFMLQIDTKAFLYPLIQHWPTNSATAETILARREGDSVVVLNELRHQKDAELHVRIPIDFDKWPYANGNPAASNLLMAKDYRGVPVLAAVSPVPNTNWYLATKIDFSEAFEDLNQYLVMALLLLALFVALIIALGLVLHKYSSAAGLRRRLEAEQALRASDERYRVAMINVGDAVVTVDAHGAVQLLNPVAEQLTGWKLEEAVGRPLEEIFQIVHEDTGISLETPVAHVLRDGVSLAMSNHTVLLARDGTARPISESAVPIRNESGAIGGAVLTFRDETRARAAAAALMKSEEQYRLLFENFLSGVAITEIILDDEGKPVDFVIVSANPAYERECGLLIKNVIGRPITEILPPDEAQFFIERYGRVALSGMSDRLDVRVDSLARHFEISVSHISGLRIAVIFRDVTAACEARKKLEQFRALIDHSNDGIEVLDPETGVFLDVNDTNCVMHGCTREEFLSKSLFESTDVTPALLRERMEMLRRVNTLRLEGKHLRKDGSTFPAEVSLRLVRQDKEYLVAVVRDITERKRVEEQLNLQSAALNAAANAIVITNRRGEVEWANHAFTSMTGYAVDDVAGKNPREFLRANVHSDHFFKNLWDTILAGKVWRGELTNRRKDGSLFQEEMAITPLTNEAGEITHFIAIKQDITERKNLEAQFLQSQKMEAVGRLAGGVAHDFNNMLAVILGYTEIATMQEDVGAQTKQDLEQVLVAGRRASDLTRQLLAFARQQVIEPIVLDLNHATEEVLKMLRRLIGEHIELEVNLCDEPRRILADPTQVGQVLANLVVNARDAIRGTGKITIKTGNADLDAAYCRVHEGAAPGPHAWLSVSDTGKGIERDAIQHIFEPFYTTKEIGKGTGLGLATVYGIVKKHGGSIDVVSSPGNGSTFTIYFPHNLPETVPLNDQSVEANLPKGNETVLLVEDETAILELTERVLSQLGYNVVVASSPHEAIDLFGDIGTNVDLLMTDVVMPTMNGKELADRLCAESPALKVLYMSGYLADIIAENGIQNDEVSLLHKPFSTYALAHQVREVLDEPCHVTLTEYAEV